jgi:hypothetical protein
VRNNCNHVCCASLYTMPLDSILVPEDVPSCTHSHSCSLLMLADAVFCCSASVWPLAPHGQLNTSHWEHLVHTLHTVYQQPSLIVGIGQVNDNELELQGRSLRHALA